MNKVFIFGCFFLILLAVFGFVVFNSPKRVETKSDKISVVASFYPLYFFAQQIGGDKADVYNITPAGSEPHEYEPTPNDIIRIESSSMLVLLGNGFEAWGDRIKQNIVSKSLLTVVAGNGMAGSHSQNNESVVDPHIWLSPRIAEQMVDKITLGFVQADFNNGAYYLNNGEALKTELRKLDSEFKKGLSDCKEKNFITSHAAFGYLAADYNLNQVSIAGLSPDSEPSLKDLARISEFAKENNIKYIFFESLVSPKLSETIANEAGAQTLTLNPLEGLTNDDLVKGKNYFTEMEANLNNLEIALQCKK